MGIDNHNMEIYYSILHFQDIFDEKGFVTQSEYEERSDAAIS